MAVLERKPKSKQRKPSLEAPQFSFNHFESTKTEPPQEDNLEKRLEKLTSNNSSASKENSALSIRNLTISKLNSIKESTGTYRDPAVLEDKESAISVCKDGKDCIFYQIILDYDKGLKNGYSTQSGPLADSWNHCTVFNHD